MVLLGSADPLLHGKATINRKPSWNSQRAPFLASYRVSEEHALCTRLRSSRIRRVDSPSGQLVVTITITQGPGTFSTAERCGRQDSKGHSDLCKAEGRLWMRRAPGDSIKLSILYATSAIAHEWLFQAQFSLEDYLS